MVVSALAALETGLVTESMPTAAGTSPRLQLSIDIRHQSGDMALAIVYNGPARRIRLRNHHISSANHTLQQLPASHANRTATVRQGRQQCHFGQRNQLPIPLFVDRPALQSDVDINLVTSTRGVPE